MSRHLDPTPPTGDRRRLDVAIAGALGLAVIATTCGVVQAADTFAPAGTRAVVAASPTPIELPPEPSGHGRPLTPPTIGASGAWDPTKGPVIANGQRLPTVTAAPVKTTAAPKPKPTPTPEPTPTVVAKAAPTQPATGLLALVNADRATAGCPPVTIAADLTSQAQTQSNAQAAADAMFHSSSIAGYDSWGENVAAGQETEAEVEAAWMASEGHRANILSCEFRVMGFASAISASGTRYWTQEFGA